MTAHTYSGAAAAVAALLESCARAGVNLTRMKIAKLLYLADLRAVEDDLKPASGVPWIWYNYGPWAQELLTAEDAIVRDGLVERVEGENFYGGRQVTLTLKEAPQYIIDEAFAQIIDDVVREFGRLSPSSLKDLTYTTAPMIEAQKGERGVPLNLSGKRPVRPVAETLKRLRKVAPARDRVGTVSAEVAAGLRQEHSETAALRKRANSYFFSE